MRRIVQQELDNRSNANLLEVVTVRDRYSNTLCTTYVRKRISNLYSHGVGSTESAHTVEPFQLFTEILSALKALGMEVYHSPKRDAQWGIRLKEKK